ISFLGPAWGALLSRLRVAFLVRALLSTTSAAAPSPRRVGDERGLDAAQPRPYLNEPSFSRARWMADLFDAEIGHVQARESRSNDKRSRIDRKSTRLNSSHLVISYAVFCLKKKKKNKNKIINNKQV